MSDLDLDALIEELLADVPEPSAEELNALARCRACGRELVVRREGKRYCDGTCRKARWRERRREVAQPLPSEE